MVLAHWLALVAIALLAATTVGGLDNCEIADAEERTSRITNITDKGACEILAGDAVNTNQARRQHALQMLQSDVRMLVVEPSGETNVVQPHKTVAQAIADTHVKHNRFHQLATSPAESIQVTPPLNFTKSLWHPIQQAVPQRGDTRDRWTLPRRVHKFAKWKNGKQTLYSIERYQPVPEVQVPKARSVPYSSSPYEFLSACASGFVALMLLMTTLRLIPRLRERSPQLAGISPWIAEFLGTFSVVFTAGCCAACGSDLWNPVANGSVLMIMVYVTYPISDGHLNPAVSLSLGFSGKIKWAAVLKYWAAQFSASIVACLCFTATLLPATVNLRPTAPFHWQQAFCVESLFSFIMCFVFLNCVCSKSNNSEEDGNQFFGLAVGHVAIAGGFVCAQVSGACFNPAIALALDMSNLSNGLFWCFVLTLAEFLGAYFAAIAFRVTRPEDYMVQENFAQYTPKLGTKCIAEFFGVLVLGLTLSLDRIVCTTGVPLSTAAALTSITYAIGDVSGGHFNPAVTAAVMLAGRDKSSLGTGLMYVFVQSVAGIAAGLIAAQFFPSPPYPSQMEPIGPSMGVPMSTAGLAEMFYTSVLAYTVLSTTTVQREKSQQSQQNFFFALAIGSCVNVGGCAIGAVTGCILNPALQFAMTAMDLMYSKVHLEESALTIVAFVFWQMLGGVFASAIFRVTHWREYSSKQPLLDAAKYFCEMVGTFTVVTTAGCVNVVGDPVYGPTGIGLCVLVMMYNMTPVSQGHLNPAVSLTFGLCAKMPTRVVFGYWIAQMGAGLGAGICVCGLFWCPTLPTWPPHPFDWQHALVAEVAYTFLICFVVINCVASIKNNSAIDGNQFYGLAAGYAVIAGSFAARSVSGAPTNPAVTFGLGSQGGFSISSSWTVAWLSFQAVGGCLAAIMFRMLRPEDFGFFVDPQLTPPLKRRCLSEFLGTFMVMLTLGLSLTTLSHSTGWTSAVVLTCIVYAMGDISSAHFNPAVTVSMVLSFPRAFSLERGIAYVIAQFAGGASAGLLYGWFHYSGPNRMADFRVAPGDKFSYYSAGLVEFTFTGLLAYTVLTTITVPPAASRKTRRSFYFGLCIGSCTIVGSLAAGAVSGAQLNPATCLGLALSGFLRRGNCDFVWQELWTCAIFALWEFAGGAAAALFFHLTHAREFDRELSRDCDTRQQSGR